MCHKKCYTFVMTIFIQQTYVAVLGGILFVLVLCFTNLPQPEQNDPSETGNSAPAVTVLVWWPPFGKYRRMPDCAALYGNQRCTVTADRDLYSGADAIIFHHRDIMTDPTGLPQDPRPRTQKWIWMNFESPSHTNGLEELEGVFNWTMSYKVDSDIFIPYGFLYRKKNPTHKNSVFLPKKKKLVSWVISNWNEDHSRVKFYWRLRRYIPIDVYGRNDMKLINGSVVQTVSQYKFYLAFENSLHTDYITEKLWHNALGSGAVPVVLGPPRTNYEKFLPGDAFIHVDDFHSPKKLAMYLKYLAKNPQLYKRYFNWKKDYSVHVASFWNEHYCSVCTATRASRYQTKVVSDLAFWFET